MLCSALTDTKVRLKEGHGLEFRVQDMGIYRLIRIYGLRFGSLEVPIRDLGRSLTSHKSFVYDMLEKAVLVYHVVVCYSMLCCSM